ncbi:MAG TPA: MerR family transcriptional regulator [Blastocatellia bacterium]|jgi:DNA-binding transcriptional MerR regulator
MRIGEVAFQAGVSAQAVRMYERLGLLKRARRLDSGYRDYPEETVTLLRFIKRAQRHGFTLGEIKSLIELREQKAAAERARELAQKKLAVIGEEIRRLQAQRDAIEHGLKSCRCGEHYPLCLLARLDN